VKQWLEETYPDIAKRAKAEKAEIHWGDETAVVNTDVRGRGYQPKGQTPVAYTVGGTRHKLSMISTVTNQGKARWMIVEDAFNSDKLIEFLEALIKDAGKKIFLILDNLRVHHSKPVKAWLEKHKEKIEVFYLPSYSPELNPDERLNALEKLAKLKPAFDRSEKGTLTAGNSSSLTDGSSTVLLASEEEAKKNNWPLLAKIVDSHTSAVDYVAGEGLLMAPTVAVSELLKRNGLKLQDFDFYEIHEAFAGQVLCTMKAWESAEYCKTRLGRSEPLGKIDRSKLNVRGSSIALGHPFAATGAKIVGVLAKILHSAGPGKRGLIVVCTAGGMGVATILES
jgi:transposase